MSKRITFGLSVKEIKKAQEDLKKYQKDVIRKTSDFAKALAEEGVKLAKLNISHEGAVYTGELLSSITMEPGDTLKYGDTWVVYTDCEWAPYVEFGTGIVGSESPHPDTSLASWKYDVNNHGEDGWVYYRDGEYYHTKGMPSRPFMYDAAQDLGLMISKVAKEVFGDE